jgi:hypothetical protein
MTENDLEPDGEAARSIIHCPLGAGIVAGSITDDPVLSYRSTNFEPGNAATEEGVITASQAAANSAARLGRGGLPVPVPAQLAAFRAALRGAVSRRCWPSGGQHHCRRGCLHP